MKKLPLAGLLFFGFLSFSFYKEEVVLTSKVKFASLEKAQELLTKPDVFTESLSRFDIDSRVGKIGSTKGELFKFISSQAKEWTKTEKNKITQILVSIEKNIAEQGYKINFPDELFFIKTTGKEEGGAEAYTRSNYIVLNKDLLKEPVAKVTKVILHELFHILSRNDPDFRKEMYEIIGFKIIKEISFPEILKNRKITNPDAVELDSYISIKKGDKNVNCVMILYATRDYSEGSFFEYLNVGFLSLKDTVTGEIEYKDHKPVIYGYSEVSDFFEQVGKNTKYIIHPEEILAENFALTMSNKTKLPSQWLVDKIREKLLK